MRRRGAWYRVIPGCEFIRSSSPQQRFLTSPIAAIVEAKNKTIKAGLGQCAAAMGAARLSNEREGRAAPVHGAVTSGTAWRFLRLDAATLLLDQQEYHARQLPRLVGALAVIVGERGEQRGEPSVDQACAPSA